MGNKEQVGSILGWVGSVISMYFFAAPAVPFYKLLKGQIKLKDAPGFLLVFSFLNCILWVSDGFLLNQGQMYITNGIGSASTLVFVTIFLAYFSKKSLLLTSFYLLCLIGIMILISWITYFVISQEALKYTAIVINVIMYGSTGEKLYRVFKTKNYNLIPMFSTMGQLLSAMCWVGYGFLLDILETWVPNGLGIIFALIQVVVYLYYYCQKKGEAKDEETKGIDENLANN